MMKAIVQSQQGDAETLQIGMVEKPVPALGEMLIKVKASGINRADISQRLGLYPPPEGVSSILGLEVSGIVMDINGDSRFSIGDEVFGLIAGGGYAEYAVISSELAIPKPSFLTFAEVASLPEVWMTAWLNLIHLARLKEKETLLIHAGASGVGAASIQLGKLLGARVFASAGSAEKLEFCKSLGADIVFNGRENADFVSLLRENGGVDVILDPVGGRYIDANMKSIKPDGRLLLIGVMGGIRAEVNLGLLLVKRISIIGSTLRSLSVQDKIGLARALEDVVLRGLRDEQIHMTIDSIFPYYEVVQAHLKMENNLNKGKIILEW